MHTQKHTHKSTECYKVTAEVGAYSFPLNPKKIQLDGTALSSSSKAVCLSMHTVLCVFLLRTAISSHHTKFHIDK